MNSERQNTLNTLTPNKLDEPESFSEDQKSNHPSEDEEEDLQTKQIIYSGLNSVSGSEHLNELTRNNEQISIKDSLDSKRAFTLRLGDDVSQLKNKEDRYGQLRMLDSERSQFTQESCSAESSQQEANKGSKVASKQKDSQVGIEEENKMESSKLLSATKTGFNLTSNLSPDRNPQFFGTFYGESSSIPSNFPHGLINSEAQVLRRDALQMNPSIGQNSYNLQTNDYNYSPDFKDSSSIPTKDNLSEKNSPSRLSYPYLFQRNQAIIRMNGQEFSDNSGHLANQQNLVRYEEFDGECYTSSSHGNNGGLVCFSGITQNSSQGASGAFRPQVENTSERILQRADHPQQIQSLQETNNDGGPFQFNLEDTSSQKSKDTVPPLQSPLNLDGSRRPPSLSIISEEETLINTSLYHLQQSRPQTTKQIILDELMRQKSNDTVNTSSHLAVDDAIYNKSKSQPMKPGQRRGNSLQYRPQTIQEQSITEEQHEANDSIAQQKQLSQNLIDHYLLQNQQSLSRKDQSNNLLHSYSYDQNQSLIVKRLSHEMVNQESNSKILEVFNNKGASEMKPRLEGLRNSLNQLKTISQEGKLMMQGNTIEYGLISEEDLLSNIDRQSKFVMPNNELLCLSEQDAEGGLHRSYTPNSVNNINTLYDLKDEHSLLLHQLSQLQSLNQQLKTDNLNLARALIDKDLLISELRSQLTGDVQLIDAEVQVNMRKQSNTSGRRKSSIKQKFGSNVKMTPNRMVLIDSQHELLPHDLSRSSFIKDYETPSLVKKHGSNNTESPRTTIAFGMATLQMNQMPQMIDEISNQNKQSEKLRQLLSNYEEKIHNDERIIQQQVDIIMKLEEQAKAIMTEINQQSEQSAKLNQIILKLEQERDGRTADLYEARVRMQILSQEVEDWKNRYFQKKNNVLEKGTSITTLIDELFSDQQIQTDLTGFQVQSLTKNRSVSGAKFRDSAFPHTIPLPELNSTGNIEFHDLQNAYTNSFSSRQGQLYQQPQLIPQTVTIINNKQELSSLLTQAQEYELKAMKLQNEIIEHKNRLMRENQDLKQQYLQFQEEKLKEIRKYKAKLDKYRQSNKVLNKENTEMKVRFEDQQQKMQALRIKMESKVQEKEFKLIMLKNQLKVTAQTTTYGGLGTPIASQIQGSVQKVYSQDELYNMINNIVQSQLGNAQVLDQSTSRRGEQIYQRPRSQEPTSFRRRGQQLQMMSPEGFKHYQNQQRDDSLNQQFDSSLILQHSTNKQFFEQTQQLENLYSPPLTIANDQQQPHSLPKMHPRQQYEQPSSNKKKAFKQRKISAPPPLQREMDHFLMTSELKGKPSSEQQMIYSNEFEQENVFQHEQVTVKHNKNYSRNKSQQRTSSQINEGDFQNYKKSIEESPVGGIFEKVTLDQLQKMCTSEMSILVEEHIQDSRQRIANCEKQNRTQANNTCPPRLELSKAERRRDGTANNSSYHSATFRKMSVNQPKSPMKQQMMPIQLNQQESPELFMNLKDSQDQSAQLGSPEFENNHIMINDQFAPQLELRAVIQQTLDSNCNGTNQPKRIDFMKKLQIRERQSRSRQNKKPSSSMLKSAAKTTSDQHYTSSLLDSMNQREDQQPLNIMIAPIMQSVSVVSDELQASIDKYHRLPPSGSLVSKNSYNNQSSSECKPMFNSRRTSNNQEEECKGVPNLKNERANSVKQLLKVNNSGGKSQKLEDIRRKYGRTSQTGYDWKAAAHEQVDQNTLKEQLGEEDYRKYQQTLDNQTQGLINSSSAQW